MAKEDYIKMEDDIVDFVKNIEKDFNIPLELKFKYIVNRKQKHLIKFTKIPDIYSNNEMLNSDIMVTINDDYFDNFDDKTKKVLIEKEFDRIEFNFEKGIFKLSNPKINVNTGFVDKFGWETVVNAIKIEDEFEQQRKDKE
jgi:hypothetical protein